MPPKLSRVPGQSRDPQPDGIGPRGRARGFRSLEGEGPGADSPAGAAVAAEVPEVPEGAPKLKAMSLEQRLGGPGLPRRDAQYAPQFLPARKRPAATISSSFFLA